MKLTSQLLRKIIREEMTNEAPLSGRERAAALRAAEKSKADKERQAASAAAYRQEMDASSKNFDAKAKMIRKLPQPNIKNIGSDETYIVVLVTGTSSSKPSMQQMWCFADLASAEEGMDRLLHRAAWEYLNDRARSMFMAEPVGFRIYVAGGDGSMEVVKNTVRPVDWIHEFEG